MKTSQEWWNEVKASPEKMIDWLKRQYIGEKTAALRVAQFAAQFANTERSETILNMISIQEANHAQWIRDLLEPRGVDVKVIDHEHNRRYWSKTLKGITSLTSGAAVASHAEAMRLERIRVIASDTYAPADIREVFQKILPDEEWHEKAFRSLSTPQDIEATRSNHEAGMAALGLTV